MKLFRILCVFALSMVPLIELRGAIPLGVIWDLPLGVTLLASLIGNMLPVPFILLFIRRILKWMKSVTFMKLDKIALWVENKAQKNTPKVQKYATAGLALFVGIPLPGTGAWTGALIAALLGMRIKYALISIFVGVLLAATIMSIASYGVIAGLEFLL